MAAIRLTDTHMTISSPTHRVALDLLIADPIVAAAWLADYIYPRQRPVYPSAVALYADMMTKGEWGVSTLMVCRLPRRRPDG